MQVLSLRSTDDEVRAAAIEAAADLTARERTLALAADAPAALGALMDAWEGVTDALTGRLAGHSGVGSCGLAVACMRWASTPDTCRVLHLCQLSRNVTF